MCLFASPSGKGSTHTNLLVGVSPRGENTDNCLLAVKLFATSSVTKAFLVLCQGLTIIGSDAKKSQQVFLAPLLRNCSWLLDTNSSSYPCLIRTLPIPWIKQPSMTTLLHQALSWSRLVLFRPFWPFVMSFAQVSKRWFRRIPFHEKEMKIPIPTIVISCSIACAFTSNG